MSPENSPAPEEEKEDGSLTAALIGSTDDLAAESPRSPVDRVLQWVPRLLSSKPHVILLLGLGVYLIVLPLAGLKVSADSELIGGNYTNVTSDIGACIAAGGTLHLIRQNRKRSDMESERLRLARETHRLLHYIYDDAAHELGHLGRPGWHGPGRHGAGQQDSAGQGPVEHGPAGHGPAREGPAGEGPAGPGPAWPPVPGTGLDSGPDAGPR